MIVPGVRARLIDTGNGGQFEVRWCKNGHATRNYLRPNSGVNTKPVKSVLTHVAFVARHLSEISDMTYLFERFRRFAGDFAKCQLKFKGDKLLQNSQSEELMLLAALCCAVAGCKEARAYRLRPPGQRIDGAPATCPGCEEYSCEICKLFHSRTLFLATKYNDTVSHCFYAPFVMVCCTALLGSKSGHCCPPLHWSWNGLLHLLIVRAQFRVGGVFKLSGSASLLTSLQYTTVQCTV